MNTKAALIQECVFKTARSGGAGGQHVNKVETKAILVFNVEKSKLLSEENKIKILLSLKNKTNKNNELIISSQKYKSQLKNKKHAEEKFIFLIEYALKEEKVRKKTKLPKSAIRKRLKVKQIKSDIKKSRSKIKY